MTFVLVSTVYAVAIGEPSFGVVGPFAVGLSLFAMVFAGESSSWLTLLCLGHHEQWSALPCTFPCPAGTTDWACLMQVPSSQAQPSTLHVP